MVLPPPRLVLGGLCLQGCLERAVLVYDFVLEQCSPVCMLSAEHIVSAQ